MLIGYARVSTLDQNLDTQSDELKNFGCKKIFGGKHSGVSSANEDALAEMIDYIRDGDTVVVTRLDRLGRSLKSIIGAVESIAAKDAKLKSLDGAVDTTSDSPMAKAMVNLIATFAQLERDLIAERTAEGQARAKAAGKHVGRPTKLSEDDIRNIKKALSRGTSVSKLARKYEVSRPTISKFKKP